MGIYLNRNQLKIIALMAMFIDHIGLYFFPNMVLFRIIGRIAFPIFAFFISEGYYYTHSRIKYFLTLLIFAILSQIPFGLINHNFLFLNILFTFVFSIVLIYIIEQFKNKENKGMFFLYSLELIFAGLILIAGTKFYDYGIAGALVPVVFYFFRNNYILKYALFCLITIGFTICQVVAHSPAFENFIQLFAIFSIAFLLLYNNEKGRFKLKNLFYTFYPVHLLVLFLISLAV